MSKNTIKIDGAKLKQLLEERSGRSLYQISEDEGFSRNFLSQACRSGKASPIVQSVANKHSVRKEEYTLPEKELKQMSIEDLQAERATRAIEESRKAFVKLGEAVNKAGEDLRASFIRLTEEWNKAIEEYNENIKRIKEGK
jgi:hypothetical protein